MNRNCVLCSDDALCPVLLWFGSGGFAPCVRGASGQVMGLNQVWLSVEEREVRCLDSLEIGDEVLAWGWGGKQGEGGTVNGVAFKPNHNSSMDHLTKHLVEEEEDPYFDIVFSGLVMRIGVDEGSLDEMEKLWQLLLEEEARAEEGEGSNAAAEILPVPVMQRASLSQADRRSSLQGALPEEDRVNEDQLEDSPDTDLHVDSGFLDHQSPSRNF